MTVYSECISVFCTCRYTAYLFLLYRRQNICLELLDSVWFDEELFQ